MNLSDPEQLSNVLQGTVYVLAAVGVVGAWFRARTKQRKDRRPKIPSDTFAGDAKVAPDPTQVQQAKAIDSLQRQLTESFEQNRRLLQARGESEMREGAYRRTLRAFDDAWPDDTARPYINAHDLPFVQSALNSDTAPPRRRT